MRKLLLIAGTAYAVGAAAAPPPPNLAGLWGLERTFGPHVRGVLVIDGRAPAWRAEIDGYLLDIRHAGRHLSFQIPGDHGAFRGTLADGGKTITGQWIQPVGSLSNTAYATPVILHRRESDVWQGRVVPHAETLSLYLYVTHEAGGTLTGSFRNPQFNFGRGDPFLIGGTGDHLTLARAGHDTGRMTGTYDRQHDTLELRLEQIAAPLSLTRRDRDSATGFYPATPASSSRAYRIPIRESDGWRTASLDDVGLDPGPIHALVERILDTRYDGFHTPYIHSLLIARHGKLVLERYFYGYDRWRAHDMRSAGKTFAGVLIGLAIARGAKFGLDTPVYTLFPEYRDIANLDARKRAVTVRDLLTMTSGLACDDDTGNSPGNEDTMQRQREQRDWYLYTLDLPMARTPGGTHAVYCSAGVNLLGGIVRNATHTPIPEFFYENLARPLDMRGYHINLMPTGAAYMGGGIEMRPRDQLKLGQLYLDGGVWNGRRIVPAAWVKESLQIHSRFGPGHGYGFAWHVIDLRSGDKTYRLYEAGGNGGQFVLILPEFDMVVGITAGNYGDFRTWYPFMTGLVPKYVIPAATGG